MMPVVIESNINIHKIDPGINVRIPKPLSSHTRTVNPKTMPKMYGNTAVPELKDRLTAVSS
jgi:hypothetical protein